MLEMKIKVVGMGCQHCVKSIEMELKDLDLFYQEVEIGYVEVE